MAESQHFLFKCDCSLRPPRRRRFYTRGTHIDDEEVQPAPGIGEVGLEAIGDPFQHHLDDKDEGENFVGKLQDYFDGSLPFDVDVLKGLQEESTEDASGTCVLKDPPEEDSSGQLR